MFKANQLCALLIALCVLGQAQATATPHSNSSAKHSTVSHSNTFGSFNTTGNKASVDSTTTSGNSFGAFGSAAKTATPTNNMKSSSALSTNLEQHQAQQNALTNFDAINPQRNASNAAGKATAAQPSINSPVQQPVINQTVIVHDRGSSGWGSGWMWFWLAESSAHHSNNTVYVNGVDQPANQVANQDTASNGTTANTTIANQQPVAQQSGTSWLVIVIWLFIASAAIGLVVSHFIHAKQSSKPRNYSL